MLSRVRFSIKIFVTAALLSAFAGCSMKKNTALSRNYTAFITRYNVYFNGDEHYRQTLDEMERTYSDDFSHLLYIHPAEARANPQAPQPSGDFSRSSDKAEKAIRLRSITRRPAPRRGRRSDPAYREWMSREEYNPFLHNAWMLLGRSRYADGQFLDAAATFYYISRHFTWLPETVTEAKLWMARSYLAAGHLFEAEMALRSIREKHLTTPALRELYNLDQAGLMIRQQRYSEAISPLSEAVEHAKGIQKPRLTFLLGQLYAATGDKTAAYTTFGKVASMSGADNRMRINARVRQSEVCASTDVDREIKSLRSTARYAVNAPYLDQIYYAIGNLYLAKTDTAAAIQSYREAITGSESGGADKGYALAALGNLYFDLHRYTEAQPCLAEALTLLPDDFKGYNTVRERSEVTDELAVHARTVELQDSLLRLSAMSPEQQIAIARRLAADYRKSQREAEDNERLERRADAPGADSGIARLDGAAATPANFTLNTDRSWYFYNPTAVKSGRADFKKQWGNRKLEDDWRRSDKTSTQTFAEDSDPSDSNDLSDLSDPSDTPTKLDRETLTRRADPESPDYYLAQIPADAVAVGKAREAVEDGLYNMSIILKDRLGDYPTAIQNLETLMRRFPSSDRRLDAAYNLYLLSALSGDTERTDRYRNLIVTEYPSTAYGETLSDSNYLTKLSRMSQVEDSLYAVAYQAYMTDDNATLHRIYSTVRTDYPMTRLMPRFMFLEALSHVKENDSKAFTSTLKELTARYPDSDVSPIASAYVSSIERGDTLAATSRNPRGIEWDTRMLADPDTAPLAAPGDDEFTPTETDGPQVVLVVYNALTTDANTLLFDLARFNFNTFSTADFDLEKMRFGRLGLIAVSGFDNREEADAYRTLLETGGGIPPGSGAAPIVMARADFDSLLARGNSLRDYLEGVARQRMEQVRQTVLPPDEYPTEAEERLLLPEIAPEKALQEAPEDTPEFDIPVPPPPSGKPTVRPTRRLRPQPRPAMPVATPKQQSR